MDDLKDDYPRDEGLGQADESIWAMDSECLPRQSD